MADPNPYAQWANPYAGFRPVGNPDPKKPLEIKRAQQEVVGGDIRNTKDAATQAADIRKAQAEASKSEAELVVEQQKADAARAEAALPTMGPNSQVHGDAYLHQYVPPAMWETVKAYARGDLGSRAGGMSASMLPIIQHAMNYDPTVSGANFPARVAMQTQLTKGDPNSIGGGVRAMEQMLLHGSNVLDNSQALNNYHSGFGAVLNHPRTAYEALTNDPKLNAFQQSVKNYAPESQKAIAGGMGGEQERQGRAASYSATMSPEAVAAGLQSDAKMAIERMGALNDQYHRVMGRDITDALSPAAKAAYDKIMAGGYDERGNALHPAPGWTPISGAGGNQQPPGGAPPGNPGGGGSPLNPTSGTPPMALSAGAAYSTPQDKAVADAISHAYHRGGGIPEMVDAAKAAGYNPTLEDIAGWQQGVTTARKSGRELQVVPQQSGHRNPVSQALGAAAMTPLGTAATGAANMAGFGALQAIAPDQYSGLSALNPDSMLAGEIGGTFAGTGGLAKAAGAGTGKFLPSSVSQFLLKDSKLANAARSLATDTAYGGAYGETTQGDPLGGAASAAIGHGLGVAGGKAAGKAIGGIDLAAPQAYLRDRGIPMTVGQLLGGPAKGIEDAMTSIPFAGDKVIARRMEGLRAFNSGALNDAGAPIGATVPSIGNDGVQSLRNQATAAYDRATAGVNVPLDPQFHTDMQGVAQQASQLPPDLATRFDLAGQNRIGPILDQGALTGDSYQQAQRGLAGYKAEMTKPGFEQDYRGALSAAQQVLKDQMLRGGGQDVVSGLGAADQAWRGMKTIDRATQAAKNGTQSGDLQTFTPAQLNTADWQAVNRYGGQRQFGDLIDAGQQVLPSKLPDSGTAKRLATQALGGGLLAGGSTGLGYASGDTQDGTLGGLGMLGLLTLGGTKAGQRTLSGMLLNRPEIAQAVGRAIGQRSGMFGTSAVPLMLQPSN